MFFLEWCTWIFIQPPFGLRFSRGWDAQPCLEAPVIERLAWSHRGHHDWPVWLLGLMFPPLHAMHGKWNLHPVSLSLFLPVPVLFCLVLPPPPTPFSFCSRCERLLCNESVECLAMPLRITYYYLTFPTNIPVFTNVFRMGPSNTVPGDDVQIAITAGNEDGFFKTEQVPSGGVMSVAKLINKPHDFNLSLELRLRRYGTLSTYLAKVLVFVTQEEPRVPYNPLLE